MSIELVVVEDSTSTLMIEDGDDQVILDILEQTTTLTISEADPGPPGPPGPGASITSTVIAGETLSGHRAVTVHLDGMAYYASNDDLGDATRQVWLTLGAALTGTDVEIQPLGVITEPSWNWTDDPVFLGVSGVLTQVPPTSPAFMIQLGQPTGPTTLMFNPRTPIVL